MSDREINTLIESKGKVIQLEGFVSTSFKRKRAEIFKYELNTNPSLVKVLLEISVGPTHKSRGTKGFADITQYSYNSSES